MSYKKIIQLSIAIWALISSIILYFNKEVKKYNKLEVEKLEKLTDKHFRLFMLMTTWVNAKNRGKGIADYLKDNNVKTVAVYGLSYVGQSVVDELESSGYMISYGIDQNPEFSCPNLKVFGPQDEIPYVDLIIVTPISAYEEIRSNLGKKVESKIASIEEIVDLI